MWVCDASLYPRWPRAVIIWDEGGSDADPIQFDGPVSPRDQDRQILLPDAAGKGLAECDGGRHQCRPGAGVFGLKPGENFWPNAKTATQTIVKPGGAIFRFTFGGDVPAIVWVGDAGHDELSVHVALWPTADAEKWGGVVCWNAGRTAGGVFATGWLERQRTPYLQETPT